MLRGERTDDPDDVTLAAFIQPSDPVEVRVRYRAKRQSTH